MLIKETCSKVYKPKTYNEAIADLIHGTRWRQHNLQIHHTWEYEERPESRKAIGCKRLFRVKYNFNGSVERFKARLVAQGISQVHGIDYTKSFAPTLYRESLRIFLALAIAWGLTIE